MNDWYFKQTYLTNDLDEITIYWCFWGITPKPAKIERRRLKDDKGD